MRRGELGLWPEERLNLIKKGRVGTPAAVELKLGSYTVNNGQHGVKNKII